MNDSGESGDRPLAVVGLIEVLARHGVAYVVIGGVATQVHGHRRTTMDLDLIPDPNPENLARLGAALVELEARPAELDAVEGAEISVADSERLAVAAILALSTRHGLLHVLKEPKGARAFDELREAALVVELNGTEVAIVSLDDLIRMKRAAGRPGDVEDIAALIEAAKQQRRLA